MPPPSADTSRWPRGPRLACAVLLALLVLGALCAAASAAPTLDIYDDVSNPAEVPHRVFLEGDFSLEAFATAPPGPGGAVECSGGLQGTLETNEQSRDRITITASYGGLDGGACASHDVVVSGFPWVLTLAADHRVRLSASTVLVTLDSCSYRGRWTAKITEASLGGGLRLEVGFAARELKATTRGCEKHLLFQTAGIFATVYGYDGGGPLYTEIL